VKTKGGEYKAAGIQRVGSATRQQENQNGIQRVGSATRQSRKTKTDKQLNLFVSYFLIRLTIELE
jgi:hypothetical protein